MRSVNSGWRDIRLLIALFLSHFIGISAVYAHAMDFSSLTLLQQTPNSWLATYQQTTISTADTLQADVTLALPPDCQIDSAQQHMPSAQRQTWQWHFSCEASTPAWIALDGHNPSQLFLHVKPLTSAASARLIEPGVARIPLQSVSAPPVGQYLVGQYLWLGLEHIALGFDHLAFVLLAVLLARRPRTIFAVVTAFTIGHSITLAWATLGVVRISMPFVEWLIALSIVFLATELIRRQPQRPLTLTQRYPALVAGLIGLIHGLGFASMLTELGLPAEQRWLALGLFNVGVEIGQIIFILLMAPLLWWARAYTKVLAYGVGGVAAYWVIARVGLI